MDLYHAQWAQTTNLSGLIWYSKNEGNIEMLDFM